MFNIALYQPDIPQNAAAIIRLCSCFDTTLEIIKPCGSHLNDKRLKKIAMDYLDKSRIIVYDSYERLKIPLKNNARSLNISIAAAITLSEALKQNYHI